MCINFSIIEIAIDITMKEIETDMQIEKEIGENEGIGIEKEKEIETEGDPFTIHPTAPKKMMENRMLTITETEKDYVYQGVILSQHQFYQEQYSIGTILFAIIISLLTMNLSTGL